MPRDLDTPCETVEVQAKDLLPNSAPSDALHIDAEMALTLLFIAHIALRRQRRKLLTEQPDPGSFATV
jgi:hypothetical protein